MPMQKCCLALVPGHTITCQQKPPTVGGRELTGKDRDGKQVPRGDEAQRAKELTGG